MPETPARGIVWTVGTYAATRGLLLVTTVALARLLEPEDFGIVALGLTVLTGFRLIGDLGLGSTILYRHDLDRSALGTVLTMMTVTGAAAAVLLAAAAPLLARGLREPQLTLVLVVLAGVLLLNGATWFYEQIIVRESEFKRRFISQLAQSVTYTVIAVTMALAGSGVWSLVGAQVGSMAAYVTALYALSPFHVRPAFDRVVARDVFGTSRGFLSLGALTFIRQNVDYLVVGRLLGAGPVGHYSMAYRLAELPATAIAEPIARVTFPAFSKMRANGEDVAPAFLSTLRLLTLVTAPVGVIMSAASQPFTQVVFGDDWTPMIGALTALGLWGALRPAWTTLGWLLNSLGRAGQIARVTLVSLVLLTIAISVATTVGTITWVAWVLTVEVVALLVTYAVIAARHGGPSVARTLHACRPALVGAPAAWVAARVTAVALGDSSPTVALTASIAAGCVVYAAAVLAVAPSIIGEGRQQLRKMIGRPVDGAVT